MAAARSGGSRARALLVLRSRQVPLRSRLAVAAVDAAGLTSRALRLGAGSVVGGRLGLAIDPDLLRRLTAGRQVALVSGTNGKTTTTRFLAAALSERSRSEEVAWSAAGANMPAGMVAALVAAPAAVRAVLEVDEAYLPEVAAATRPEVVLLTNLSRDQLDRVSEVRILAARWRAALAGGTATVVASADDPLVVWAAGGAGDARFVGVGSAWHDDAHHCPGCDARIEFSETSWACTSCSLRRPPTVAELEGDTLVLHGGHRVAVSLAVPGAFNRRNAALAAVAAGALGRDPDQSLAAIGAVREVAGRFSLVGAGHAAARLMLAKNPAGWAELIGLLAEGESPLVAAINARVADGLDPSWLWDVPFEALAGRLVVASGERCEDLAVRLLHAGVAHETVADPVEAVQRAARLGGPGAPDGPAGPGPGGPDGRGDAVIDVVGNYTAFQQLRRRTVALPAGTPVLGRPAEDRPPGATGGPHEGRPAASPTTAPRAVVRALRPGEPSSHRRGTESALRVVVVHPDLLGTYGDGGNGRVLADRALWRGIDVELVLAASGSALPERADCYCIGGGEDGPQVRSAEELARDGERTGRAGPALRRAVERGATVLAVCAGFQIAGTVFPDGRGRRVDGLGLLDVRAERRPGPRAVGEVVAAPLRGLPWPLDRLVSSLTGFENHASTTLLGPGIMPLARVRNGVGNGEGGVEGAVSGTVVGTYLHGPVLARNPALADALLAMATGAELAPLADEEEAALRAARLGAAERSGSLAGRLARRRLAVRKN